MIPNDLERINQLYKEEQFVHRDSAADLTKTEDFEKEQMEAAVLKKKMDLLIKQKASIDSRVYLIFDELAEVL
jgi:hypothetical protein